MSDADPTATFSALKSPFGDLTEEEFKNQVLFPSETKEKSIYSSLNTLMTYKDSQSLRAVSDDSIDSFDWVEEGKLTEIKNQGTLGTCWAFSAITVLESQVAIKENRLIDLSVEQLVECANYSNHSSGEADCAEFGGWPYLGFKFLKEFGGVYEDSDFPYCSGLIDSKTLRPGCFPCMPKAYDKLHCGDHSDLFCDRSTTLGQGPEALCKGPGDKRLIPIKGWKKLPEDEEQLANILKKEGPISVAMSAMILQFYFGGVISIPLCSNNADSLDHAIVLVGYGEKHTMFGNTIPYWKVRNSWGKTWGEEGYFRLKRGNGMCGINLRASIGYV